MPAASAVPATIASLTRAMVKGDDNAYREFHSRYVDRLARYLIVVSRGNEQAVRDALAEAFRRVVKHIRVFDDESVFWSWLTVVARTAYLDEQRHSRRYFSFLDRFMRYQVPSTPAATAEDEAREQLRVAVEALADDDRRLVELKYYERWPVRDIAAHLGTTEASIESRLVRVRRKLKEDLVSACK